MAKRDIEGLVDSVAQEEGWAKGRGLDAFRLSPPPGHVEVEEISIELIDSNPYQPREAFHLEELKELAASIQEHGFYGHLLARKVGDRYQIAYGERRLRAARLAGFETVPLHIRELGDSQMLEISLTENVQREDLSPVEEGSAYVRLRDELGLSVREIAQKVGKGKSYIGTLLRIMDTPDVAESVRSASTPVRTAEELAKFSDPTVRQNLIRQVESGALDRQGLIELRQAKKRAETESVTETSPAPPTETALLAKPPHPLLKICNALLAYTPSFTAEDPEETLDLLTHILERVSNLLQELQAKIADETDVPSEESTTSDQ